VGCFRLPPMPSMLWCVFAAADFMRGCARPPEDRESTRQEGWI
jgi:hypothetical protein